MINLNRDMTKGNEFRHIIVFALPLLAGNILQQFYNVVDLIIVGRYIGPDALAAVGTTGSMTYLFYTLCLGLAAGSGILVAQFFGAGKTDEVKSTIVNSAGLTLVFGLLITLVSVFLARPILIFLNTPDSLLDTATGFLSISCYGTLAVGAYNWINGILRSLGDSFTPLIILGLSILLNIVLDLFFILGLHMGVNGAAAATVISQAVAAVASILLAFRINPSFRFQKKHLRFDKIKATKCIQMGIPIAAQNALVAVSMVALQRVTNSFGEVIVAAYTTTMRIEQFIQQPFSSLNIAISTFVGQNTGAGQQKRVVKGYHTAMKISFAFSGIILLLFLLFRNSLVEVFVNDQSITSIAQNALLLSAFFYPFLGTIHVTRGFLNGAGDTGYALINGVVEVVCRVGFSFLLMQISFLDYWAVWGTTCITWTLTAVMSVLRYKSGKWKRSSKV